MKFIENNFYFIEKWLKKRHYKKMLKKHSKKQPKLRHEFEFHINDIQYKKYISNFYKQKTEDENYWKRLIDQL